MRPIYIYIYIFKAAKRWPVFNLILWDYDWINNRSLRGSKCFNNMKRRSTVWIPLRLSNISVEDAIIIPKYPLVNFLMTMVSITMFNGKKHNKWSLSIAMLNYRMVYLNHESVFIPLLANGLMFHHPNPNHLDHKTSFFKTS